MDFEEVKKLVADDAFRIELHDKIAAHVKK